MSRRAFSPAAARTELALESRLSNAVSRDSNGALFRVLTDRPHPAGSARNKELAEYVAADKDSWQDAGPAYFGLSAPGDVTAPLIYASSGTPGYYEWLKAHGVDPA